MNIKDLLIVFFIPLCATAQVDINDSLTLVVVYNATDGSNWTKQENWLTAIPLEDWEGIEVSEGRVTAINFSLVGLDGPVPEVIFTLDSLKEFSIRENNASLDFDSRVQMWTALEVISVSGGNMSGDLSMLCGLTKLREISYYYCPLGGMIPICLQSLKITRLNLNNAQLDAAELPAFLGEIPTLINLTLTQNQFSGPIPATYCNSNFRFLTLSKNQLSGQIPDCLNSDDNLNQLFLDDNDLEGEIPVSILGINLSILELNNNNFTGQVEEWPHMPALIRLCLQNNSFSGTFDGAILSSDNYRILNLENNNFENIINFPDFPLLNTLNVKKNTINFSALEALTTNNASFVYAPQNQIGNNSTLYLQQNEVLDLFMDAGGTITSYQWFKDAEVITGATQSSFSIAGVNMGDAGTYHCEALHDSFPDLNLKLAPVEVNVGITAIDETTQSGWKLLGNPVQSRIILEIDQLIESTTFQLTLSSINGRQILTREARVLNANQIFIDTNFLSLGVFVLQILHSSKSATFRILKL